MAAKLIDKTTTLSEGTKIVEIAEETQKHHHTKTCKKKRPDCRFGMPRFPLWKTTLTEPLKGKTDEERNERRKKHREVLNAVREVLENEEAIQNIWKEFGDKKLETKEENIKNRKCIILKVLKKAKVSGKSNLAAVREQTKKGLNMILARDIDEIFINNYNPEWLLAWNANLDIQPCFDFFTVSQDSSKKMFRDGSNSAEKIS